jgi:hypothetical protein
MTASDPVHPFDEAAALARCRRAHAALRHLVPVVPGTGRRHLAPFLALFVEQELETCFPRYRIDCEIADAPPAHDRGCARCFRALASKEPAGQGASRHHVEALISRDGADGGAGEGCEADRPSRSLFGRWWNETTGGAGDAPPGFDRAVEAVTRVVARLMDPDAPIPIHMTGPSGEPPEDADPLARLLKTWTGDGLALKAVLEGLVREPRGMVGLLESLQSNLPCLRSHAFRRQAFQVLGPFLLEEQAGEILDLGSPETAFEILQVIASEGSQTAHRSLLKLLERVGSGDDGQGPAHRRGTP